MTKAERIRRTQRIIKRRWRIAKRWMMPLGSETKEEAMGRQSLTPHRLHKFNLKCGCPMCKCERYDRREAKRESQLAVDEELGAMEDDKPIHYEM